MLESFTLITAVWGKNHPRLFLEIGLPSLMASNNIPKLAKLSKITYVIYSTKEVAHELLATKLVQSLQQIVDLQIVEFEYKFSNNHEAMSWCHKTGFNYAIARKSYAVFIPPDCIWSEQSMLSMYNIVKRGYKIIHMSGLRLISELFCPEIHKMYPESSVINISSRELVKLSLNHLHPITNSHFFDEKEGALMPANLLWSVGEEGILARNFHFHPLLINAVNKKCDFKSTIDDDLGLHFNAKDNEEYIVDDSDELIAFEMSSWQHKVLSAYRKGNVDDVVTWATTQTNVKHREYIKTSVKLHRSEMNKALWDAKIEESNQVVKSILAGLEIKKRSIINLIYQSHWPLIAIRLFGKVLNNMVAVLYLLIQSKNGPYVWNWKYCLYKDINKPMYSMIESFKGKMLYIDAGYVPLEIKTIADKKKHSLQIDILDPAGISNPAEYMKINNLNKQKYDYLMLRNPTSLLANSKFWGLLDDSIKANGNIICNVNKIDDYKKLSKVLPTNMILKNEKTLGGFGTKFARELLSFVSNKIFAAHTIFRFSIIRNSALLLLIPLLTILSPIFSLIVIVLNNILPKQTNWAEKSFVFVKKLA